MVTKGYIKIAIGADGKPERRLFAVDTRVSKLPSEIAREYNTRAFQLQARAGTGPNENDEKAILDNFRKGYNTSLLVLAMNLQEAIVIATEQIKVMFPDYALVNIQKVQEAPVCYV